MLKKRNSKRLAGLLTLAVMSLTAVCGCGKKGTTENTVVYEDMQAAYEEAGLMSSNVGIFSRTDTDDSISFGEGGSGVIFKKDGDIYYVLTAAHVVSDTDAQLLVFTVNTELTTEEIYITDTDTDTELSEDELSELESTNVLTIDAYNSMYMAELLYTSTRDDLAIICFYTDEDLAVAELADDDPEKKDRIMCIGNPNNEWFSISYGQVTSGLEEFGELTSRTTYAMKHTAFMQTGSSGGAAINEDMKLTGITPGASLSLDGSEFYYGVLIPTSEIKACIEEWEAE